MKLTEFKSYLAERLYILKINIYEKLLIDLSSTFDNWVNILFSPLFNLIMIIFINVLYSNVHSIASYSKNEMLFFLLIGQINFFGTMLWSTENLYGLTNDVRTGGLDLVLSKPLPSLFYTTFRKIDLLAFLKGVIPPVILLSIVINWSNLSFSMWSILAGAIIIVCGQITLHFFQFFCAMWVFWRGSGEQLVDLSWVFEYNLGRMIPYEGLNFTFRTIFTTIIPVMISTGLTTSVFLGKSPAGLSLVFSILVATASILAKSYLWKLCLRNYSSASS